MNAPYPRLIKRIKAALVDFSITTLLLFFCAVILQEWETTPSYLKFFVFLLPIFITEPLLVSLTGGSLGHHLFNIKIKEKAKGKRLSIPKCIIRFLLKVFLGPISTLYVLLTSKHLMFHDIITGSIVDYKSQELPEEKVDLDINYIDKGIIKHKYVDRGFFTIAEHSIYFGNPSSYGTFFCYLSIAIIFYLTTFCFVLYYRDSTAAFLFAFVTIYCSPSFILPIKDMLLSNHSHSHFSRAIQN